MGEVGEWGFWVEWLEDLIFQGILGSGVVIGMER